MKMVPSPVSPAVASDDAERLASERRGGALMVLGGALLGTVGLFVEEAGQHPLTTVWFRCAFGSLALVGWAKVNGRMGELALRGKALGAALGAGALMLANWALFFAAIQHTSIGVATIVYHVHPFWVLGLGVWWLKESVTLLQMGATLLALCGLILASGLVGGSQEPPTSESLQGLAMCVVASISYAAVTLIAKLMRAVSSLALATWQCLVGVTALLWWPLWHGWPPFGAAWAFLVGLGIIHSGIAYVLLYAGMSRLPASRIALLQFVYPGAAVLLDWVAYGRGLGGVQIAGVSLMAVALWTVRRPS